MLSIKIDCISIVADGESILDTNLSILLAGLIHSGLKVVIICNGSTIDKPEIRGIQIDFDLVFVRVATVTESI